MKITHKGHACLLIETDEARILTDPGNFSDFDDLTGLDAILITHQHPDHCDPDKIEDLIERNPDALVRADPQTAAELSKEGIAVTANKAGDTFTIGDIEVTAVGG